jgi:hypothetical protein
MVFFGPVFVVIPGPIKREVSQMALLVWIAVVTRAVKD